MDGFEPTVAPAPPLVEAPPLVDGAVQEARIAVASVQLRALTGCSARDLVGMQLDLQRVEACEGVIKEVQQVVAAKAVSTAKTNQPVPIPKAASAAEPKAASAAEPKAASAAEAVPRAKPAAKRSASTHAILVGKLMRLGLSGV